MKAKFTILSVLAVMLLNALAVYSQDNKVQDPGIWNQFVRMKWYTDRGLQMPNDTKVTVQPMGQNDNIVPQVLQPNFTDGADIEIFNSLNAQSENSIAISTANSNNAFISTNGRIPGANPTVHQTWFFSTNAGANWFGSESLPPTITESYGDPVALFTVGGKAIFSTLGGTLGGIKITTTTNFGTTWTAQSQADPNASTNDDKQHTMTDVSGTFPNNVYNAWTDFNVANNPVSFTRSTDDGTTWSARTNLPIGTARGQGTNIAVGPNGEVYVCWGHYPGTTAETGIGFAKSVNGGSTFGAAVVAFPISGIRITNGGDARFNNVRVSSFPHMDVDRSSGPGRGYIYIVTPDQTSGHCEVKLWKSTDGGTTWSSAIVVSQATSSQNWCPSVAVDKLTGNIAVSYYAFETAMPTASRWLAISTDFGATWDRGRISDVQWTYAPQGTPNTNANYNGDYFETAFLNNKIMPCWSDNRTIAGSQYNKAFISIITLGPPPANDCSSGPFMTFPNQFINATNYTIKSKITNVGTATQTSIPCKFFVDGVQVGTTVTIPSLAANAFDTTTASWSWPATTGAHVLKIAVCLAVDNNRVNDTVTANINVLPAVPIYVQFTTCRNGLNKPIPDLSTMYDTINVNIAGNPTVSDVNVRIDTVTHTWDSDLTFTMLHGAGSVSFISAVGGSGDNFIGTFLNDSAANPISGAVAPCTGTFSPSAPLSGLNGTTTNGAWILRIVDGAGGDSGTLYAWCLQITYQSFIGINGHPGQVPTEYKVSQNYPNPFNPTTIIEYEMPKAGHVTMKVFDVLGREVATLVNDVKQVGIYQVHFDASNLASGIYFYKVDLGDGAFNVVKKMMLIK